jgi:hypothetical protein
MNGLDKNPNYEMEKCILFTDIKKSSKLWAKFGDKMGAALDLHRENIEKALEADHLIIKTIGDAYMISFDTIGSAISFACKMVYENIDVRTCKNIPREQFVSNDTINEEDITTLQIRIGICYGPVQKKDLYIQKNKLIDYFGETVNLASRMESKVSKVGSFALCLSKNTQSEDEVKQIIDIVIKNCCANGRDCKQIDLISYKMNCNLKDEFKRSGRMVKCENVSNLNSGNRSILTYLISNK